MIEKIRNNSMWNDFQKKIMDFKKRQQQMLMQTNELKDMIIKIAYKSKILGNLNCYQLKIKINMSKPKFFKSFIVSIPEPSQSPNLEVIGFVRLSSKNEIKINSVKEQAHAITDYCNSNKYNLKGIIGN